MDRFQERLRLRGEIAGLRVLAALVRLELKYRPDQARVPKGQGGAGQFAPDHGGGAARAHPAFLAPAAAAAERTVARAAVGAAAAVGAEGVAALAPAAGAVAAGMVGVSRAAGLATQAANGGGVTPILHIPFDSFLPKAFKTGGGSGAAVPQGRFDKECEEQLADDLLDCQTQAAMYGRGTKNRATIAAVCERTAIQRYGECLRGGPDAIKTPIYSGRHHNSPERKR